MTRLKEALAGAEGAIIGRLATIALGIVVPLLAFFAVLAFNDIKADNDLTFAAVQAGRSETAALREEMADQNAVVQGLIARFEGTDRAQGVIDAGQDRRLDAIEGRVQRLENGP